MISNCIYVATQPKCNMFPKMMGDIIECALSGEEYVTFCIMAEDNTYEKEVKKLCKKFEKEGYETELYCFEDLSEIEFEGDLELEEEFKALEKEFKALEHECPKRDYIDKAGHGKIRKKPKKKNVFVEEFWTYTYYIKVKWNLGLFAFMRQEPKGEGLKYVH